MGRHRLAHDAEADEPDDLVSRLERLSRVHDSGALSDDEYLLAKTKLLS